jgi:myo-inositol 2-dehydrogenase / D-chiro-inositol 1-dehydrogenase
MRFAVLGTGRMASGRAALLRGQPDVGEVLLAGHDRRRTEQVAAGCGARAATIEEALGAGLDGVIVASSTERHLEQLLAAAPLGVPVLCEKPIALSLEATSAALDAFERAAVPVQVGFQRRFDPGFRALHQRAAAGRLGTLYSLRITARDATPPEEHYIPGSGGIFRDMHVHDFDLARWLTGREVATVYATGAVRGFERFARHGDADTSAILLTMDDGMPVLVDGSRHDPLGYDVRMELVGSEDVVAVGLDERTPLHRVGAGAAPAPADAWTSFAERFAGAFAEETAAFVALARDGGESPCPPQTALEALRVAVACEVSIAERRPVAPAEIG